MLAGKCTICSKPAKFEACTTCSNRAEDLAFEKAITIAAALDFLARDRSQQIQRSMNSDLRDMKYVARHSHPIVSRELVFAPNKTVSDWQLRLRGVQ